jgi:predicted phosphodiesterase
MKIAVLADVHSNFVALQAAAEHLARWQPDQVILAGDLVNRGPRPAECLDFFQAHASQAGWLTVRGNHEEYVIEQGSPEAPVSGPAYETHRASRWTYQRLGCDLQPLLDMPFQQSVFAPDGSELRVVHASMGGNRDGIYPHTPDEQLAGQIAPATAVLCVGHTHRPLIRKLDSTLIVNAGSVGLPFDGNQELAYAQITWRAGEWCAEIVRLPYDVEKARSDFFDYGYYVEAGPLVQLVLVELLTARSMLFNWSHRYQSRAEQGSISMQDSVKEFLLDEFGASARQRFELK